MGTPAFRPPLAIQGLCALWLWPLLSTFTMFTLSSHSSLDCSQLVPGLFYLRSSYSLFPLGDILWIRPFTSFLTPRIPLYFSPDCMSKWMEDRQHTQVCMIPLNIRFPRRFHMYRCGCRGSHTYFWTCWQSGTPELYQGQRGQGHHMSSNTPTSVKLNMWVATDLATRDGISTRNRCL